jgi:hypothetical protein
MANLVEIYKKYSKGGSDKGITHSYIEIYNSLFSKIRSVKLQALEIGVRTGHSIAMWDEYFTHKNTKIYGVDIETKGIKLKFSNRVSIIKADATDNKFPWPNNLDIVIDDGSHKYKDQVASFNIFFNRLAKNGIYIIEDISDLRNDYRLSNQEFKIIDLRNERNRWDNIMVIYRAGKINLL